jgi:hypothetical protein
MRPALFTEKDTKDPIAVSPTMCFLAKATSGETMLTVQGNLNLRVVLDESFEDAYVELSKAFCPELSGVWDD